MKRYLLSSILYLLLASVAAAGHLLVDVRYATSGQVTNRRVALKLQQPGSVVAGPWLIAGDYVVQRTDVTGQTIFSNVLAGGYSLTIYGSPERSFSFGMPDTNGLVSAASLVGNTNTTPVYYTAPQIDALLAGITNGGGSVSPEQVASIMTTNDSGAALKIKDAAGFDRTYTTSQTTALLATNGNARFSANQTGTLIFDNNDVLRLGISRLGDTVFYDTNANPQLIIGTSGATGNGVGLTNIPQAGVSGLPTSISNLTTVLNVKEYGAVGDGTTDDAPAIQAAFNAAVGANPSGNRAVYFPHGVYAISNTINITNAQGLLIKGDGMFATEIRPKTNAPALRTWGFWYSRIQDIAFYNYNDQFPHTNAVVEIDGNQTGGYVYRTVQGNIFENVYIYAGYGAQGLSLCRVSQSSGQGSENLFINFHVAAATNAGVAIYGANALQNTFIGGNVQNCTNYGIYVTGGQAVLMSVGFQNTIYNNYDFYTGSGTFARNTMIGCRSESLRYVWGGAGPVDITGWVGVPTIPSWTSNAYSVGDLIIPTGQSWYTNHIAYKCTTAGNSGATEPTTWATSGSATVADGGVVWTPLDDAVINIQYGGELRNSRIPYGKVNVLANNFTVQACTFGRTDWLAGNIGIVNELGNGVGLNVGSPHGNVLVGPTTVASRLTVNSNVVASAGYSSDGTVFHRWPTNAGSVGDVVTSAGDGYLKMSTPTAGAGTGLSNVTETASLVSVSTNLSVSGKATVAGPTVSTVISNTASATTITTIGLDTNTITITSNGSISSTSQSGAAASVALPGGASATGSQSIALGYAANANGLRSFAGPSSTASARAGVALGESFAYGSDTIALGRGAKAGITGQTGVSNIVAIGYGAVNTNQNTMLIGGSTIMNLVVSGSTISSNGYSSDSTVFTRMPTNMPADGQFVVAAGSAGHTKFTSSVGLSELSVTNFYINSNSIASWPTAPNAPGAAYFGNSNGVIYLLTSGVGSTWTATNKIAP